MKGSLNALEKQILEDLLARTPDPVFYKALAEFSLQTIYERRLAYLTARYFKGNKLKASTTLRALFNKFQTLEQEQEQKELYGKIEAIKVTIRRYGKYSDRWCELVKTHNIWAEKFTERDKHITDLRRRHRKHYKQPA